MGGDTGLGREGGGAGGGEDNRGLQGGKKRGQWTKGGEGKDLGRAVDRREDGGGEMKKK